MLWRQPRADVGDILLWVDVQDCPDDTTQDQGSTNTEAYSRSERIGVGFFSFVFFGLGGGSRFEISEGLASHDFEADTGHRHCNAGAA